MGPVAPGRKARTVVACLLVAAAATVGALGHRPAALSSTTATTTSTVAGQQEAPGEPAPPPLEQEGVLGLADGAVPEGTTVLDDVPAVARLDPDLLAALRRAAGDAAGDGIEIEVNGGWRSPAYQQHLLDEATVQHGSRAEAARWVATPETSAHVRGAAVDVGPAEAAAWLAAHGARYGLCQTYGNEPWHFELHPETTVSGCPPPYPDPTHDPRMRD